MTTRQIFYNDEQFSIRAGWRIALFIIIVAIVSFSILSLVKIVFAHFPYFKMQSVGMFFVYISLTLATWITLRFVDKRPFVSVGITWKAHIAKELSQGLVLGFGMMSVIYVAEYSLGWVVIEYRNIATGEWMTIFANSAFLYVVVGYGEELLFRGYILQTLAEGTNKIIAVVSFSVIFGYAHAGNPNVTFFALVNVVLAGIWLSVAYFKTGALWLSIGLHISWNFTQGFIYSFPVSGTTSIHEQIGTAKQFGPAWITGGAFGPEGGTLATAVIILGTALIYFSSAIKKSEKVWTLEQWKAERTLLVSSQQQTTELS